jgi:hypothetical protein
MSLDSHLQLPKDVADALEKLQGESLEVRTLRDLLYDGPFQALGETLLSGIATVHWKSYGILGVNHLSNLDN